jgi:hypothetical protein
MKKENKNKLIILLKLVGAAVISLLVMASVPLICGWTGDESPSKADLLESFIFAFVVMSSVLFYGDDEEDAYRPSLEQIDLSLRSHENAESKTISSDEVLKLKWSTLMGPSTRDQVQEVVERKGGGWRLPTQLELTGPHIKCPYHQTYSFGLNYWLQEDHCFIERSGSRVHRNVPPTTKANFCLVREV